MNKIDDLKTPVLVYGAGKSGIAAAKLLQSLGLEYGITDRCSTEQLFKIIKDNSLTPSYIETGFQSGKFFSMFSAVVLSPGCDIKKISSNFEIPEKIEIISEIELAFQALNRPIIAVTGTNGKTTTTALLGEMIKKCDETSYVCGNIGHPFSEFVEFDKLPESAVLEVSSYQLEHIKFFQPEISVITNITPDHLSRHGTMLNYTNMKFKIAQNMNKNGKLILNLNLKDQIDQRDDLLHKTKVVFFSIKHSNNKDQRIWVNDETGNIIVWDDKEIIVCNVADVNLPGNHNLENTLAAILSAYYYGVSVNDIRSAICAFHGVEHRLEIVPLDYCFKVFNDSKATNPDSTVVAVKAMDNDYVLILGGSKKDVDYSILERVLEENCKKIILTGDTSSEIREALKGNLKKIEIIEDFDKAVKKALNCCLKDSLDLLFSPACASFDKFNNFEHRGEYFKSLIRKLHTKALRHKEI